MIKNILITFSLILTFSCDKFSIQSAKEHNRTDLLAKPEALDSYQNGKVDSISETELENTDPTGMTFLQKAEQFLAEKESCIRDHIYLLISQGETNLRYEGHEGTKRILTYEFLDPSEIDAEGNFSQRMLAHYTMPDMWGVNGTPEPIAEVTHMAWGQIYEEDGDMKFKVINVMNLLLNLNIPKVLSRNFCKFTPHPDL